MASRKVGIYHLTCFSMGTFPVLCTMNETDKPNVPSVRRLEISPDYAGQRIDNFLITHLKGVPRSHLYRLLRRGEVRVNKGRIGPEYRLKAGDMLRIPPIRQGVEEDPALPGMGVLELVRGRIIHEDDDLLVLNKPAGLAVHGGSGLRFGAIEVLRALRPEDPHLELVHRLDRDTSGLLMIAKRRSALRRLHALLREGAVEKRYLVLVKGIWQGGKKNVDAPLLKNHLQSGERMVRVDATGKAAVTRFTPLSDPPPQGGGRAYPGASLLEALLVTGRTHQIRVHATYVGHPVAGDEKYGDPEFNRVVRSWGIHRLFLHAHRLKLEDEGRVLSLEAPLDETLQTVITALLSPSRR
ncbi:23S rRNA pseudouridine(955/2504/2580) synthase [Gammaproteobacteria bacterium]